MATVNPGLPDTARVQIYWHFMDSGRAPAATDIAQVLGRDAAEIEQAFVALADGQVIVLAPGTRSIWMAHPFSAVPTPFPRSMRQHVLLGELRLGCLWDRGNARTRHTVLVPMPRLQRAH